MKKRKKFELVVLENFHALRRFYVSAHGYSSSFIKKMASKKKPLKTSTPEEGAYLRNQEEAESDSNSSGSGEIFSTCGAVPCLAFEHGAGIMTVLETISAKIQQKTTKMKKNSVFGPPSPSRSGCFHST